MKQPIKLIQLLPFKHFILCAVGAILCQFTFAQSDQELKNIQAFGELFGYVKYFHPSDEAFENDWDYFAIYGVREVAKCKDDGELLATLQRLYAPIAPTLVISKKTGKLDLETVYPPDTTNYKITFWQHEGVNYGNFVNVADPHNIYKSSRVGHPYQVPKALASAGFWVKPRIRSEWMKKPFRIKGEFKFERGQREKWGSNAVPELEVSIDENVFKAKIPEQSDSEVIIEGVFPNRGNFITIGVNTFCGKLSTRNIVFEVEMDGKWQEVNLPFASFDSDFILNNGRVQTRNNGHFKFYQAFQMMKYPLIIEAKKNEVTIAGDQLFEQVPEPGAFFELQLAEKIYAAAPYALFFSPLGTYPKTEIDEDFKREMDAIYFDPKSTASKVGNLITTWNLFKFFHPYISKVEGDWDEILRNQTKRIYKGLPLNEAIENMAYHLDDGQFKIEGVDFFYPPFSWERLADNKLVITDVARGQKGLNRGDIITGIDNQSMSRTFSRRQRSYSSFSESSQNYHLNINTLRGTNNTSISLMKLSGDTVTVRRTQSNPHKADLKKPARVARLDSTALYLNLGLIQSEAEYRSALAQMEEVDYSIIDFRDGVNPAIDAGSLESFFVKSYTKPEQSKWKNVHRRIYPDSELEPVQYGLTDSISALGQAPFSCKMICLIDGGVQGFSETVLMMLEEHRKDLLIVGQQSAGANGAVNPFVLPGGYTVFYTGMEVRMFDGQSFFGVAILPDIKVENTLEDILLGNDPILHEALKQIDKSHLFEKTKPKPKGNKEEQLRETRERRERSTR